MISPNPLQSLKNTSRFSKYVPFGWHAVKADFIQKSGERDIVALYTSFLGHAAIKKYADYLASQPLETPRGELERALRAAASYHLDVRMVAEEAAKLSRDRAIKVGTFLQNGC